jgi:DNA processing protein
LANHIKAQANPEAVLQIITLQQIYGLGNTTIKKLLNSFSDLEQIRQAPRQTYPLLPQKYADTILEQINNKLALFKQYAQKIISYCQDYNIQIINWRDPLYPSFLKTIKDNPVIIYYKGNLDLLTNPEKITVVGTRNPTPWGHETAYKLVKSLAHSRQTIVSGLALGIDTICHQAALKNNTPTLAIVAHGLEKILPRSNRGLAREILQNQGGILSEYPPFTKVLPSNFVQRDRLLSAIAPATIVVQSGVPGGAMVTADFARKQNRLLACPAPPSPNHPKTQGLDQLLSQQIFCLENSTKIQPFLAKAGQKKEKLLILANNTQ